jgi:hypothetical protein
MLTLMIGQNTLMLPTIMLETYIDVIGLTLNLLAQEIWWQMALLSHCLRLTLAGS